MKTATRVALGLIFCAVALGERATVTVAQRSHPESAVESPWAGESPLVVPGLQPLDEDQQLRDATLAARARPAAFFARQVSQKAFEHLAAAQAESVAKQVFPHLIDEPAGGPPRLAAGEKLVRYISDNAAQISLPGGRAGVLEALAPMALASRGRHVPLDLRVRARGTSFEPALPAVAVQIPRHLDKGIRLAGPGVTLTPVDAGGSALSGSEGVVAGAGVLYANTMTDTDALAKATTAGFALETLLRSERSPEALAFRVGMPPGAKLLAKDGAAEVSSKGRSVATISPPSARDTEGEPVPVSMRVSGTELILTVAHFAGRYRLPIAVDPTVNDNTCLGPPRTAWYAQLFGKAFHASNISCGGTLTVEGTREKGEWGGLFYTTKGESQITSMSVTGNWNDSRLNLTNQLYLTDPNPPGTGKTESYNNSLPENTEGRSPTFKVCAPEQSCPETVAVNPPENGNTAFYQAYSTESVSGLATSEQVVSGSVTITQPKGPEVSFNTSSPTIHNERTGEEIPNVLYGSGGWLGPHNGAFEARARDGGIGLSLYRVAGGGTSDYKSFYSGYPAPPEFPEGCKGVQCPEHVYQPYLYNSQMRDGQARVEVYAEDAACPPASCPEGTYAGPLFATIKVDGTPPHAIKVIGLQNGDELPLGESHLKVEATDGEGETHSSGVKSITVQVDGQSVPGSAASCAEGPCTAATELTLAARDYASGLHSLVVTATDNASNVAQEEFKFRVHGATPISVGPGSVDPSTGELTLGASDVSLGGGIGVSRTYQSRHLTAGTEGPLGPQWAINQGGDERLTVQPDGSAVLLASGGAHTTFARNEKGEFVAPTGDSNLKLEPKEKEAGKGITEYLLRHEKAGTQTKFERPRGAQNAPPTYANQFGTEAGELKHPVSDAIDSAGNVWVTDNQDGLIDKFSATGTLLASYGSQGSGADQFTNPWGIAIDPRNGNVYVSDQANNRIEELSSSGAFIKTFGWGVSDGKAKLEVCTKECKAGLAGAGEGQVSAEAGMSVDSSGDVWLADFGNNRIEEFNEKGEFLQKFGSAGKGTEQFEGPLYIAFSGGNLYITDNRNERVQEFSISGAPLGRFGGAGGANGQLSNPWGIATDPVTGNLYVADSGNARVQEFTPAGAFVTKFGSAGGEAGQFSAATGVAVNASGSVYALDYGANQVEEWMRATWVPTEVSGALAASTTTYAYGAVEAEGKTVIEPTEAIAPVPAGVSCTPNLNRGCRALTFNYAKTTTASGENESEWGDYAGHLTRVYFTGWDPAAGKMSEPIAVAQYAYDNRGRLRAEWDPRISPALKTLYGYDDEGHVTAVSPPGQEPWIFTYGTIAGSPSPGRLLKVMRPPANTSLWGGEVVKSTEVPKLSGSPYVGVTMGVSHGSWSGAPGAYAYQWEDCNGEGKACVPIPGATNANYTVASSDDGHALAAVVTATSAGGSAAASAASRTFTTGPTAQYGLPKESNPAGITTGPDGNLWFTDSHTSKIGKITKSGQITEYPLPVKGIPGAITTGPDGNLWFTVSGFVGSRRIGKITTSGHVTEYPLATESSPKDITVGPDGNLWITGCGRSQNICKMTTSGQITEFAVLSEAEQITTGPDGNLWVTVPGTCGGGGGFGWIKKLTTSGIVTQEYRLDHTCPRGITAGPDGNIWFTNSEFQSTVGKITPRGESTQYPLPERSEPEHIIQGPDGNLWFTEWYTKKIAKITTSGGITEYTPPKPASPRSVAAGPDDTLWYTDYAGSTIGELSSSGNTEELTQGENHSPEPGSTLEYAVPVAGSGLPSLDPGHTKAWAQEDNPVEGVAIVPPDEPMGWPASSYKRATIHYWDAEGRMVNAALPTGGIATSEYNATNDVVRTLSADNRAAALKEGAKSAEVSKLLDTRSSYSSDGTELLETHGPRHKVKLAEGGAEVLARSHVKYFYDEGAPGGQTFGLVTKKTAGAEYEGKESDVRTTVTSYSGPNNVGWKLRKPTSVTTDPGGLNLTQTTVYDEATGNVLESTSPAGSAANPIPSFTYNLGSFGSGERQFEKPWGVAVDQRTGNIYVSDYAASRVEELSPTGEFVRWIGQPGALPGQMTHPEAIAVDAKGNIWVGDGGNERIDVFNEKGEPRLNEAGEALVPGGKGSAGGQFGGAISGITTSATGVWATDTANNRVERFGLEGKYKARFGKAGSKNGQFSGPTGIVLSAGSLYVDDSGHNRVERFSTAGKYQAQFGTPGKGNGQLEQPIGLAIDPKSGDLYVSDYVSERVEEFTQAGKFVAWLGFPGSGNGQFKAPLGVATSASGNLYVADSGNARISVWLPAYSGLHTVKTVYYSVQPNSRYPQCGNHSEWANLPCQTEPAAQPNTNGIPNPPVVTVSYNVWGEVESTSEAFGSTTRVKRQTYDPAGRALTSEVSSSPSVDKPLPVVTNHYNEKTGALETQTTSEGSTKTITQTLNQLGQPEKYTDADGGTTTYTYDVDGRTEEVNYGKVDGETASQIYSYDSTTGFLTKLFDTAAKTFTASYDVEGNMTSETYPNGMTATYARGEAGGVTGVEYIKTTNCSSNCTWFHDAIAPSIHGETLKQVSSLAEEPSYTYDAVGRLTQIQEIPAGKSCVTRAYAYDQEGNRVSQTTAQAPVQEPLCTTSNATSEAHTYDDAGRLYDSGVSYDVLGNMTNVPATDAGGKEPLKSTYYVDNQIATQEQEGKTLTYGYDPAGRRRETATSGKTTSILHYAGPGEALVWTAEGAEKWSRNVPGIDGSLTATQSSGEAPVLILHDLQGNAVATASLSESETKLLSTYRSTEFGVPQPGSAAPKYGWLGAEGASTELPTSGVVTTGASSYVPEIGRALQTAPVTPPGAFPNGTGGAGLVQATYISALSDQMKGIALEHEAALEAAARREAEEKVRLFGEEAANCGTACLVLGPGEGNCEVDCIIEGGAEGVEGGGTDPHEVLTGKQALSLAKAFLAQAFEYGVELTVCSKLNNVGCAGKYEPLKDFYGIGSEELKDCYAGVHGGRHNRHGEYENGVCWISWEYTNSNLPTNLSVEQCWSGSGPPGGRYGLDEWYCRNHGWRGLYKL